MDKQLTYSDLIRELEIVYLIAALHGEKDLHFDELYAVLRKGIEAGLDSFYQGFTSGVKPPPTRLDRLEENAAELDKELRNFFETKGYGIPVKLAAAWLGVKDSLKKR